ncbi:MAG: VWA domain-containing protein [Thermodesulfobacteriota bacterium]
MGVPLSITLEALDTPDDVLVYDFYPVDLPSSEGKKYKVNAADGTLVLHSDTGLPILDWPDVTAAFNAQTRTFTWTPAKTGTHYFKATVSDDGATIMSASEVIRIVVCNPVVADEDIAVSLYANEPNEPANLTLNMIAKTQTSKVPVSGLKSDHFKIFDDSSELIGPERGFEILPATTDVLLLLDLSGSVMDNGVNALSELKTSAKKFIDYVLQSGQTIGVYYFNSDADITEIATFIDPGPHRKNIESARQQLHAKINNLDQYVDEDDSSNLYGAIINGIDKLDKRAEDAMTKVGTLVVFSDGRDTAGRKTYANALGKVTASKHNVITVSLNVGETDRSREGRLISEEQQGIGKNGWFGAPTTSELTEKFILAAFEARREHLKSYILAFCLSFREGLHTLTVNVHDPIGRFGAAAQGYNAAKFEGGCSNSLETEKVKYFDFDSDKYYFVDDDNKTDCNDLDPYNWNKCDTCMDQDGDGFGGKDCNINSDCKDDLDAEPYADLINPNMADTETDGWDQNCDGYDGRR